MARKYRKLDYQDRKTIERMLKNHASVIEIAGTLGTNRDTLYKEFERSGTNRHTYNADAGQRALKRIKKEA